MQLSEEIIKTLEVLCQSIGITINWSSPDVLLYLQQLIKKIVLYEVTMSYATIILIGIIIVAGFQITKFIKKFDKDAAGAVLIALICLTVFFFVPAIITQIVDIITCYTLPEKIIYEFVTDFITKNN